MTYDVSLWPATVYPLDAEQLASRMRPWRRNPDFLDTVFANAGALQGHAEKRSYLTQEIDCSCRRHFGRDLTAFVTHQAAAGGHWLERHGYLPAGSADMAVVLLLGDYPGSLDDLSVTVSNVLT